MTRTAYNLNPIPLPFPSLMLLSVMLAAILAASPRLHAAEAGYSAAERGLTVDCGKRYVSQQQAGRLLGTDNFSRTYARRATLYAEIARACAGGAAVVRVEGRRQATAAVVRLSGH